MARPGQALVEYVLMVVLVAIVLAASLYLFRETLMPPLERIPEEVECVTPGTGGVPPGQGGQPPGLCGGPGGRPGRGRPGGAG